MPTGFVLDDLPDLVSSVEQAVFHVEASVADGVSSGAGFAIALPEDDPAPGILVTNAHVLSDDRAKVRVHAPGRIDQRAKIRLVDNSTDLALLEVPEAPAAVLPARTRARVGEPVIAIGSPLAVFESSVSFGIVSALGRLGWGTDHVPFDGAIQTDAAINHGNSGGPLIGMDGHVIGVNYSGRDDAIGINFAIPIALALDHYAEIRETGANRIRRGSLGIRTATKRFDVRAADRLGHSSGAEVLADPAHGSPAKAAGLRAADVIVSVDGEQVTGSPALVRTLARRTIGQPVRVTFVRRGKLAQTTATPVERRTE